MVKYYLINVQILLAVAFFYYTIWILWHHKLEPYMIF